MSAMKSRRVTVAMKIGAGFGLVLFLLVVVGGVSFDAIRSLGGKFGEFSRISTNEVRAGRLQANMAMARIQAIYYIYQGEPERERLFRERYEATEGFLKEALDETKGEKQLERLHEIEKDLATYGKEFDRIVELKAERDHVVHDFLDADGPEMERALSEVMASAHRDGDASAAFYTGEALRNLLLGRLYMAKYLTTNESAAAERARTELASLDKAFETLDAEVQNPERRALVAKAHNLTERYEGAFESLVGTITERNRIRDESLAELGTEITQLAEDYKLDIIARQNTLSEESKTARQRATMVIMVGALAAIVLGVGISIIITRGIVGPVGRLLASFKVIATGDLTEEVKVDSRDEIGELSQGFNEFVATIRGLVAEVSDSAHEVAGAATEIAASSEQMAKGMEEQSGQTAQVASAVEEMAATVHEVSAKSSEAAATAGEATDQARNGGAIVQGTVDGMNEIAAVVRESAATIEELGRRGEQIGAIIEVINDIADQTNLLALNAAIEAARAGEHGRGFAVVADEVRKLADRTTTATDEIAESIQAIQDGTARAVAGMTRGTDTVDQGVGHAQQAGTALSSIVSSSNAVSGMIQDIAAAAEEQSAAAEEISRSVESISAVTRQATSGANQAATAATQLSARSEGLQALVSRFKISNR
ncbi:MAG: methyl-accepting chemotaxis protein [Candidatus Eisenbacteria bacterium]|nr:methyl-accepting chemotaxis protein [Candidatus Eisenbacteria bacterium]